MHGYKLDPRTRRGYNEFVSNTVLSLYFAPFQLNREQSLPD
jgi:hypothetical protein